MSFHPFPLFLFLLLFFPQPSLSCLAQHQYQTDSSLCSPCYHKCLTCIDSTPLCDSCNPEYYLSPSLLCLACPPGCSICSNSSTCQTCNTNFYLTANLACSPCTIGVSACTISTISSCMTGYYLLGGGICAKCIENCESCNNSVGCVGCEDGYYVQGGVCVECGGNCRVCTGGSSCTECEKGYKPVTGSNTCSVCTGTGNNLVYSESTQTCINCPTNCLKCDTSICYYCDPNYILSSDQTTCTQGASLLCYQSKGTGYTNCQVDINGCPDNTIQQYDTSSGFSVPTTVCLPKSFTSSSQYVYDSFTLCDMGVGGSTNLSQKYEFVTEAKYQVTVQVQLMILTPAPAAVAASYGTLSQSLNVPSSISTQSPLTSACTSAPYILWNTQLTFPTSSSSLTITTPNVFISQIYLQAKLCSVLSCASCTTNLDCTSCLSPYFLQLNECIPSCETGFYTYLTNRTCYITCPDTTYAVASEYSCKDCDQGECYLCSEIDVCLSCKTGFYLYGGECVANCSAVSAMGYYGEEGEGGNVCRACPFPCKTCSVVANVTVCYSCNVGYLYEGKECVLSCPNGTYPLFTSTLVCEACKSDSPYFCSTCAITSTTCLSCVSSYYLLDSQCLSSCPSGYYGVNSMCSSCQSPCLTCSSTPLNCSSCSLGSYYWNPTLSLGQCLLMCPTGAYNNYTDTTNPLCSICATECSACYGPLSTQCTACASSYYLYGSSCLTSCVSDNTTYQNSVNNTCSSCSPPCKTCSPTNGSSCTSCTVGFLNGDVESCSLVCNETSYALLTATVYTCMACPAKCYACNSDIVCKSCVAPYLLLGSQCIDAGDCPVGYFWDTTNLLCTKCSSPCAACSNSISCLSCISSYYLYNNSKCVSACPDGTLLNVNVCESCDGSCVTCSIAPSNCTSCFAYNNELTYLYQHTCISSCPSYYYPDSSESTCFACEFPCLECYNMYLCISCADLSYYLYDNQCLEECPSTTLPSYPYCLLCTDNCLSCSGATGNCTSCSQLYYYYFNAPSSLGSCLQDCPSLYYNDIFSGNCLSCISPCLQCSSETICTSCLPTYSLYIETCITTCPAGYYSNNNICIVCTSPCSECSSATNCSACTSGFYMPFGETWTEGCLTSCPVGQYPDSFNQQCSACSTNCVNCSSLSVCWNCSGASYLYLNTCLPECLSGYYPKDNVCQGCPDGCQRCSSPTVCTACITNHHLYNNSCFNSCPSSTYPTISVYQNIMVCYNCSANCLNCSDYYQCLVCASGFFLENGQCISSCSLYYYSSSSLCLPCGFSCSVCLNSSHCLNCSNTYIHENQCFSVCPPTTYSSSLTLTCPPCISPCLTCINEYSCTTCVQGYKFYQSICVDTCPNNTWVYKGECLVECVGFRDYEDYVCYDECPREKVAQNGICLSQCAVGSYVSVGRVCMECGGEGGGGECGYLFKGELQLVAVDGFQLVLYFNQRAELLKEQDIKVTMRSLSQQQSSSKRLLLATPTPTSTAISSRSLTLSYPLPSFRSLTLTLQIPYIRSLDTNQSIYSNLFTFSIYNYQQPSPKFNNFKIISYIISSVILLLFIVNILYGVGHYQAVLQLAQTFCMLNYLEIYYPWPLYQFFEGLQLVMFAPIVDVAAPYLYSFSPAKFIRYNVDISFSRSALAGVLFVFLPIAVFLGVICLVTYLKREVEEGEASRGLRFCRVVRKRVFWRYLNDYFFTGMVWVGVFAVATFRNSPLTYTILAYVLGSVVIVGIVGVIVFIFFIVLKNVRKRKRELEEIEGLIEDLENDSSTLGLMYTPILYLRKLLLICLIGLYSTFPISSLFMLMVLSALLLVILFFYKPFKNPTTDYIVITLEFCLILTIFLLVLLKINQDILSEGARFGIGLAVVIIDAGILLVGVGWWGYLTVIDYVMKFGFRFGETTQLGSGERYENKEKVMSDGSNMDEIKENKLEISSALDDLTNKYERYQGGGKAGFKEVKGEESNYNIYDRNESENQSSVVGSGSEESNEVFKYYRSDVEEEEENEGNAPERLRKKSVKEEVFEVRVQNRYEDQEENEKEE